MRDAVNTVKVSFLIFFWGPRCKSLSFGRESFVFSPIRKRVSKGTRRLESLRAGDPLIQGQRGILENEQEDEGGPRVFAKRVVRPANSLARLQRDYEITRRSCPLSACTLSGMHRLRENRNRVEVRLLLSSPAYRRRAWYCFFIFL